MSAEPDALFPDERETGIKRRNFGLNHAYYVDGAKVPGVTTITGFFKSGALANYPAKATREYAMDNWLTLSDMTPAERRKALTAAQYADRDAAAGRGTAVHKIAQQIVNLGPDADPELLPEVPDTLTGHVEQYVDFLDRLDPQVAAVELVVANRTVRYCGTLDLIADLGPVPWDGAVIPPGRWLLDLKTSRSGIWPETALQLCAYEHAEVFIAENGDERPVEWLGIERCGAVWVRGDGWDLIPLDTGPETWQAFRCLAWLVHRDESRKEWVGAAAGPFPAKPAAA
jgi:hypothetical protein